MFLSCEGFQAGEERSLTTKDARQAGPVVLTVLQQGASVLLSLSSNL